MNNTYVKRVYENKDYEQLEIIYQKLMSYSFKVTIKCCTIKDEKDDEGC